MFWRCVKYFVIHLKSKDGGLDIVMEWGTLWEMLDYNTKYSPIMENQILLLDMEKKRWLVTYRQNHVKMTWAFINIMNAIHHLGWCIMICERTTSCYIFYLTNQMLCTLVCAIGVKLDGYIHGWGTQKECFTPKSLSKHYFEWPLHLQNIFLGRFFFSLDNHILLD
jgi:hypothetical protein